MVSQWTTILTLPKWTIYLLALVHVILQSPIILKCLNSMVILILRFHMVTWLLNNLFMICCNLFKIFCMNVFRGQNILYISYSVLSQLYLGLECTTKYVNWYIAKMKEVSELFLISKDILLLTNLGEHWRFEILFVMV